MNFKENTILKIVAHILLPICIAVFILSVVLIYAGSQWKELRSVGDITKTERFADSYLNRLGSAVSNLTHQFSISEYNYDAYLNEEVELELPKIPNKEETLIKEEQNIEIEYNLFSYNYTGNGLNLIVIDNETEKIYTNYEKTGYTDTLEKLLAKFDNDIKQNPTYWIYKDGKVETSIKKLELAEIKYQYYFEQFIAGKYTVYSSLDDLNSIIYIQGPIEGSMLYKMMANGYEFAYITLPISLVIGIAIFVYLSLVIGHKRGHEGIYLNGFDKLPFEIVLFILGFLMVIDLMVTSRNGFMQYFSYYAIIEIGIILSILYVLLWIGYITFVRRVKSKTIWKNTLTYKIFNWAKRTFNELFSNFALTVKVGVLFSGFVIISDILCLSLFQGSAMAFFILFIFYVVVFLQIIKGLNKAKEIRKAVNRLYIGEKNIRLNIDEYKGDLKELAIEINDISAGFSNAIEESLKSERLKTELITNVSHDIKTPLTSIINYADLLKKEGLNGPKAEEYLKVINEKSQKLKKLTEDLVEASKASSGNVKLNLEKIDSIELINQMLGDFEDKFEEEKLDVILSMPEDKAYISADGKLVSRVFQNLFCNISKYAMTNTRVYIDIVKEDGNIKIKLKNISREKLNISSEELIQRFVRGDSSRNTEGSGLGLSIAESLIKLQNGKFDLFLDGDFFKVTVEFKEEK